MKSLVRLCRTPAEWMEWHCANHRIWKQKTRAWLSLLPAVPLGISLRGPRLKHPCSCIISLSSQALPPCMHPCLQDLHDKIWCSLGCMLRAYAETLTPKVMVSGCRVPTGILQSRMGPHKCDWYHCKVGPKSWVLLLHCVRRKPVMNQKASLTNPVLVPWSWTSQNYKKPTFCC